jgi:hypothetical protein
MSRLYLKVYSHIQKIGQNIHWNKNRAHESAKYLVSIFHIWRAKNNPAKKYQTQNIKNKNWNIGLSFKQI